MSKKDIDIVAAGHICLDLIPAFTIDKPVEKMTDVLVPGKMINMGKCVVAGGGPVTNAGVSIRRLGVKTELIGKIGDDDFGQQILRWYEENEGHFEGIKMVEGESTSYTIAICIPGIDRFYLHHCGANDTFGYDDMDFDLVGRARLMLFGYPPWMKKIYENTGAELTRILQKTKELGTTTALDLSLPDVDSPAGQLDWKAILHNWVPLSDIMVPSAEELFFFLYKEKFLEKKDQIKANEAVLDLMTVDEIATMGKDLIDMGAAVAMVKCGNRGLYIRTAGKSGCRRWAPPVVMTWTTGPTASSGSLFTRKSPSLGRLGPRLGHCRFPLGLCPRVHHRVLSALCQCRGQHERDRSRWSLLEQGV